MDYCNFLKDKRVALVGPSPSIIGSGNGNLINNCDIIVRMNKAIPVPVKLAADIGSRTDVLYNCMEPNPNSGGRIDIKLWNQHRVKWVCSSYPVLPFSVHNIKQFIHLNNMAPKKINFRCVAMNIYTPVAMSTKTRPNTGLLAICDILNCPVKSLYITGMTFGKDGYYREYNNMSLDKYHKMANGVNHKQFPQFEYFCNLVKHDARIIPDKVLQGMIK